MSVRRSQSLPLRTRKNVATATTNTKTGSDERERVGGRGLSIGHILSSACKRANVTGWPILWLVQRVWLSGYRIFMMGRGFYTPRIWQRVDFQTDEEKAG